MAFVKGAAWGVVAGGVAVVTGSLIAPQPVGNTPPLAPQIVAPQADLTQPPAPDVDMPEMSTTSEEPTSTATEPVVAAPTDPAETQSPDTETPPAPEMAMIEPTLEAPDAGATPDIAAATEEPVLPNPQSVSPQVPEPEDNIELSTAPPPPVAIVEETVEVTQDSASPDGAVMVTIEEVPVETDQDTATDAPTDTVPAPDAEVAGNPSDIETQTVPVIVTTPTDDEQVAESGDAPAVSAPPETETPSANVAPDTPTVVSIIDGPTGTTTDAATGVTIRRPSGDTPAEAETNEADTQPALVEYAAFFDNPDDLPVMSVVLIDDGALPDGPRALQEVPFPVTVVLNPSRPGVSEVMDAYRAGGFEVAAQASLPEGATAADVAVALEATFDALPETVAMVQTDGAAFGRGDPETAQIMDTLASAGRGLLQVEGGSPVAAEDVPTAVIYRDLTDVDQDARVIRRFMDQAAFRAGQQDGVVLLAGLTPETLSALILWGAANRARQVAMAPLSATLLAGGD